MMLCPQLTAALRLFLIALLASHYNCMCIHALPAALLCTCIYIIHERNVHNTQAFRKMRKMFKYPRTNINTVYTCIYTPHTKLIDFE